MVIYLPKTKMVLRHRKKRKKAIMGEHIIAFILGIVEGLTEYLPVSSTGHLILVGHLLGTIDEGAKSFEIVIQLGAILAVIVHYRGLLWDRATGLVTRRPDSIALLVALVVGFLP